MRSSSKRRPAQSGRSTPARSKSTRSGDPGRRIKSETGWRRGEPRAKGASGDRKPGAIYRKGRTENQVSLINTDDTDQENRNSGARGIGTSGDRGNLVLMRRAARRGRRIDGGRRDMNTVPSATLSALPNPALCFATGNGCPTQLCGELAGLPALGCRNGVRSSSSRRSSRWTRVLSQPSALPIFAAASRLQSSDQHAPSATGTRRRRISPSVTADSCATASTASATRWQLCWQSGSRRRSSSDAACAMARA